MGKDKHIILSEVKEGKYYYINYKCLVYFTEIKQRRDVYNNSGCKSCNLKKGLNRLDPIEYENRFKTSDIHEEYELLTKYVKATKKIRVKHKLCGHVYDVNPSKFISGSRCHNCRNFNLTNDEFKSKYCEIYKGYELISEFKQFSKKMTIKHISCGYEYDVSPTKFKDGRRCPKCSKSNSKMEAYVEAFLSINDIKYYREYSFDDCRRINKLKFDFVVKKINGDIKLLIECDGSQHYDVNSKYYSKNMVINDSIKNHYCLKNEYNLIRIKESELSTIFEKLGKVFKSYKIPTFSDIDKFYRKKINFSEASSLRVKYLKVKSSIKIAKEFNISSTYVLDILKYKYFENQDLELKEEIALELKSKKRAYVKCLEHKSEFIKMYENGLSYREIGRRYNINHQQVKKVINFVI